MIEEILSPSEALSLSKPIFENSPLRNIPDFPQLVPPPGGHQSYIPLDRMKAGRSGNEKANLGEGWLSPMNCCRKRVGARGIEPLPSCSRADSSCRFVVTKPGADLAMS